jgi:glycosyltransferase involved in cell wall biosynthesis
VKLSLAITTFERYELTLKAFSYVCGHYLIDEVVIVDDHSSPKIWNKLKDLPKYNPKVKVFHNLFNLGMAANKCKAVELCQNEHVILLDSDNVLTHEYLNAIPSDLHRHTIYAPEFARPNFDYRHFAGETINLLTLKDFVNDDLFWTMLNTCNYVVPKTAYLETYKGNKDIKETDTLWFNYLWLKAGHSINVLRGMQYEHLVHEGSGWLKNAAYNMQMNKTLKNKIVKELCQ